MNLLGISLGKVHLFFALVVFSIICLIIYEIGHSNSILPHLSIYEVNKNGILVIKANPCHYDKDKGPRILCAIFTKSESNNRRMKAIHDTWSKR